MDPHDVSAGEGTLPRGGGHERLVRLQRHARAGRVRQPGVPEEDGLHGPDLPQTSVRQTDPAGKTRPHFPRSSTRLGASSAVKCMNESAAAVLFIIPFNI